MAIDAQLEKLLDDAGIIGEDRDKAVSAFSVESLGKVLKDGVLRQSDYSRNMDALKKQKDTLETNWKTANDEYVRMQNDLAATQAEKATAATKLKETEDKLAAATQIDPTKVVTPAQLASEMAKIAAGQTAYFGDVLEIADEHRELFGSRLNSKKLIQDAMAANKTPMDYWNETYNVLTKREEVAKAKDDERIASIKAEARKEALAEYNDPNRRPLRDSDRPFYESRDGDNVKSPWDDIGPTTEETNLVHALQEAGR